MAGNISKYFYEVAVNKNCAEFHHPGKTCVQAAIECFKSGLIGSAKFYFPLCFLPLLVKFKHWNKIKTWKEFFYTYARCIFSGFFITSTGFILFCLGYNIFKKYHFPTIICLPASLGAIFCGFLPEKYLHIDGLGLFNMYIEFIIKQSKLRTIIWMRNSKFAATLMYSFMNATILYCLFKLKCHRFWFINMGNVTDIQKDVNHNKLEKENLCYHGDVSCDRYFKKEIKQTAAFAFGVSLFKLILPRFANLLKNPKLLIPTLLKKFDYGLFMFLVVSNGIFKYAFCRLNQLRKLSMEMNCLISGIVSSIGYIFYPRYIIFTMGITSMIELIYKYIIAYYESHDLQIPKIMTIINRLPIPELIYIFSIGMMFQLRVIYPHLTNRFVHKMMSIGSGGRSDEVAKNYAGIMMGIQ